MRKYKMVNVTDDGQCECGRILKRTFWLVPLDKDGNEVDEPSPYGRVCAGRLLSYTWDKLPKSKQDKKIDGLTYDILDKRADVIYKNLFDHKNNKADDFMTEFQLALRYNIVIKNAIPDTIAILNKWEEIINKTEHNSIKEK